MRQITLLPLSGTYAVARLDPLAPIPGWADGPGFVSISRTADELSVVCLAGRVPDDVRADRAWSCFKFQGPFAFDETGIAAAVLQPLAADGIGIFLVSTFDTDYLLVQVADRERVIAALRAAGHRIG
ncbi:ACT domain-containing protein [Tistrella mobilis]|uniref:ACT domain-containing protein n=1 Tax=Tistrella mobilis TaxID=171437 RepID=UPI00355606DD